MEILDLDLDFAFEITRDFAINNFDQDLIKILDLDLARFRPCL